MKVLIVDDHPLVRSGIKTMLLQHGQADHVLEAPDLRAALACLRNAAAAPDLILVDLQLPDCSGSAILTAIREAAPRSPMVVIAADDRKDTILGSLDAGAMGFIPKTFDPERIWAALGTVLRGGIFFPRDIVGAAEAKRGERRVGTARDAIGDLGLTARQAETLAMLVQGWPNKTIACKLGISEATVKVHMTAILRALNVTTRTQAVIWLAERGFTLAALRPDVARQGGEAPDSAPGA